MENYKPLVFISYSSEDRELVNKIYEDCKYYGIDVWLDKFEIFPGESLRRKIFQEGIGNSSSFVVFITDNSINSAWVQKEIDAALIKEIEDSTLLIPFLKSKDLLEKLPLDLKSKNVAFYDEENGFKKVVASIYKSHILKLIKQKQKDFDSIMEEKNSKINELIQKEPDLDLYLVNEKSEFAKEMIINKTPYEYQKVLTKEMSSDTQNSNINMLKLLNDTFKPNDDEIINYINYLNHIAVVKLAVENRGNFIAKNFNIEIFSSDEAKFEINLPKKPKGNFPEFDLPLSISKRDDKNYGPILISENNVRYHVDELLQGYKLNLREIFLRFENSSIGKKLKFDYSVIGENYKEKTGKFFISIELQPLKTIDYERFKNKPANDLI